MKQRESKQKIKNLNIKSNKAKEKTGKKSKRKR